jgi:ribosomal protein L35
MKQKTHSGAKKRLRPRPGGTVKRRQINTRHQLVSKSAKTKRNHHAPAVVHSANEYQVQRLLLL